MNAKILIVALCAFQLAAGGIIDDFVAGPLALVTAPVSALLNTVQGQAALVQQQFQDFFQSATQNLTSQLDFGLWQFEQNISALNGSSQADACNYNHTQQYYSIGNESLALFKAGASILNQTIVNGSKILRNVASNLTSAIPQAISNYTTCVRSYKGLFSFIGIGTCAVTVGTKQFAVFANTTTAQIQSAQRIFSQLLSPSSVNSTVHTLPQMAELTAQIFTSMAAKIAALNQQTWECLAQALNATFTGSDSSN